MKDSASQSAKRNRKLKARPELGKDHDGRSQGQHLYRTPELKKSQSKESIKIVYSSLILLAIFMIENKKHKKT